MMISYVLHSGLTLRPAISASPKISIPSNGHVSISFRPRTASKSLPTGTVRKMKGGALHASAAASSWTSQKHAVNVEVTIEDPTEKEAHFKKYFNLDLVSSASGQRIRGRATLKPVTSHEATYKVDITVPAGFEEVGAVMVENVHPKEMYFKHVVILEYPLYGNGFITDMMLRIPTTITCNSWVQPTVGNTKMRVFFTNKSYLPSETPAGIKKLREKELQDRRGNGEGERVFSDRIYDYDVYNDLGEHRKILGGTKELPYPRRCRTGRARIGKDQQWETATEDDYYVPRDETFSAVKQGTMPHDNRKQNLLKSTVEDLIPALKTKYPANPSFTSFTEIDQLYEGVSVPDNGGRLRTVCPDFVKTGQGNQSTMFPDRPDAFDRDKFSWLSDDEFARQTLAGLNPCSIQLVTEWPMKTKLESDPAESGIANKNVVKEIVSRIKNEHVEKEIGGMTVEQAVDNKKLFVLDYHGLLMPYVEKVRDIPGSTLYASRTLFYLRENGTLKPIAIELTCTKDKSGKDGYVVTHSTHDPWLWRFAKVHVLAHDSGYHQLIIHWLRTHCCMEPYIIAANRQLSAMHPIYRLLHPHFRYTMEINAFARKKLIREMGIIESTFSLRNFSMELSSVAYKKLWRFDEEALPADLIKRGMAVKDPNAKHGLKFTIEDYPFANDGLLLWDAITSWVTDYVRHYYQTDTTVETDAELQKWWEEVRTKGHGDMKDEPWWPVLDTLENLIHTLSTIIWIASGFHAAVNFGQYAYAGYMPNRPTVARTDLPGENFYEEEFRTFAVKPEAAFMECFPSKLQTMTVMSTLHTLSYHSPDEEYIGDGSSKRWLGNPVIQAAFEKFVAKVKDMEIEIDKRNKNMNLRNRIGAGVVPYELLRPTSLKEYGVTGMGIPNSISI